MCITTCMHICSILIPAKPPPRRLVQRWQVRINSRPALHILLGLVQLLSSEVGNVAVSHKGFSVKYPPITSHWHCATLSNHSYQVKLRMWRRPMKGLDLVNYPPIMSQCNRATFSSFYPAQIRTSPRTSHLEWRDQAPPPASVPHKSGKAYVLWPVIRQ